MRLCLLMLLLAVPAAFATPPLAASAPQDTPGSVHADKVAAFERAIAPYVAKARATYPAAKKRYLAGLPRGDGFYVTTRLHDKDGKWEQVFISVSRIAEGKTKGDDKITGTIASKLTLVKDFARNQPYTFPESELMDWTIAKHDGREEGNFVGKFLETYRP